MIFIYTYHVLYALTRTTALHKYTPFFPSSSAWVYVFVATKKAPEERYHPKRKKSTVSILPINHCQVNFKMFKCVCYPSSHNHGSVKHGAYLQLSRPFKYPASFNGTMIVVFFQRPFIWHCHLRLPAKKKHGACIAAFPCVIHFGWYPWKFPWPTRKTKHGFGRWSSTSPNTINNLIPGYLYVDNYIIPSYNVLSYKGGLNQPYAKGSIQE